MNPANAETISVTVIGKNGMEGTLFVAIFDNAHHFPDGKPLQGVQEEWVGAEMKIGFSNIKPGSYGIAVFLDRDGNGSLSTNLLGIPREPYGFSGYDGFGKPSFADVAFEKAPEDRSIQIEMN
jgi:uncharacterized protein (DUF2141 family)